MHGHAIFGPGESQQELDGRSKSSPAVQSWGRLIISSIHRVSHTLTLSTYALISPTRLPTWSEILASAESPDVEPVVSESVDRSKAHVRTLNGHSSVQLHSFSRDLARPGGSEEPSGMWTEPRDQDEDDDEEEDEDEDEDEDSDEDEDEDDKKPSASTAQPSSSALQVGSTEDPDKPTSEKRAERKAAKKVGFKGGKGDDDDDDEGDEDLDNPNRGLAKNMKASDLNAPRELSRRERCVYYLICSIRLFGRKCAWSSLTTPHPLWLDREQAEKAAAQARYQKMHAAGKVGSLPFFLWRNDGVET